MNTTPVCFRLKGNRTYIHGTDMYSMFTHSVAEAYPNLEFGALRMTIHHMATRAAEIAISAPDQPLLRPADAFAEFKCSTLNGVVCSYLVESGEPITQRYAYDEEQIESLCTIEGSSVSIAGDSGYAAIEVVVAMNKHLHNTLFPLSAERWMFTRLEIDRLLQQTDAHQVTVTFGQRLGTKLSRSLVIAAGQPLGHIYFSAVPK